MKIDIETQEVRAFLYLLDIAVKAAGLEVAGTAVVLAKILTQALEAEQLAASKAAEPKKD